MTKEEIMYKGDRALCAVLLGGLVVAMALLGLVPASASTVLTAAEEMDALRGGCAQLYCIHQSCGGHHECSLDWNGYCTPGETCKNTETYSRGEVKQMCGVETENDYPCTKGPLTPCGLLASCICYKPFGASAYICGTYDPIEDPYGYYPCN